MQSGKSSRANYHKYIDRQQKIVDDLAAKFRNIVVLAASQGPAAGGDVSGQEAAGKVLSINVETQSLVCIFHPEMAEDGWKGADGDRFMLRSNILRLIASLRSCGYSAMSASLEREREMMWET